MNVIKKVLGFLTGRKDVTPSDTETAPEPIIVTRADHTVSRKGIDGDALKVLNRLNRFKHTAYLVGGGVRDLLLDRSVKDFDIATSAHPHEVKRLFRNSRLIGRRFRLVHILFRGQKVIEVSTFRRHAGFGDQGDLLIKSDNTFGNPEEDARRRDFTINGLFYNIADFTVIDYVGGLRDLESKIVNTIGDPEIRFREDPIRMLRAVRFAARLGFAIEPATKKAIETNREEVWRGAVPRILEEILRILQQRAAADSFRQLHELKLLEVFLPRVAAAYQDPALQQTIQHHLEALDAKAVPKEGFSPALLICLLYLPCYNDHLEKHPEQTDRPRIALEIVGGDLARLSFPKLQLERSKQLLAAQHRLLQLGRKRLRPAQLARKTYFADALLLFELTQTPSSASRSLLRRWRSLQQRVSAGESEAPPRRSRAPRKKRGSSRTAESAEKAVKPQPIDTPSPVSTGQS